MIQAQDLRIGNWVNYYNDNVYFKVVSVGHSGLDVENSHEKTWIERDQFQPIPITPEILEKAGFIGKYKSCGYHYTKDIVNLSSQDEDDYGNSIENYQLHFYHNHQGAPIYFVHQLQNLYHSLIGEELKLEL